MPHRWIISPVVETLHNGTQFLRPKCATFPDLGRRFRRKSDGQIVQKNIGHSSIYAGSWVLSVVVGFDLSALDADLDIRDLSGEYADNEHPAYLEKSPDTLLWSAKQKSDLISELDALEIDTTGLNAASSLKATIERIGKSIQSGFDVSNYNITVDGPPDGWEAV